MNLYDVAIRTYEASAARPDVAQSRRLRLMTEILNRSRAELVRCIERIEKDGAEDADAVASELSLEIGLMKARARELSLH